MTKPIPATGNPTNQLNFCKGKPWEGVAFTFSERATTPARTQRNRGSECEANLRRSASKAKLCVDYNLVADATMIGNFIYARWNGCSIRTLLDGYEDVVIPSQGICQESECYRGMTRCHRQRVGNRSLSMRAAIAKPQPDAVIGMTLTNSDHRIRNIIYYYIITLIKTPNLAGCLSTRSSWRGPKEIPWLVNSFL